MDTQSNNDWRKLTTVIYRKPRDSKIFGSVELDVTAVEAFVRAKRQEGLKITLTHIFLLALARGIQEEAREINSYVRRGRIILRKSVDVSLTVLLGDGQQLTSVKITQKLNRIFGGRSISTNQLRHTYLTGKFANYTKEQKEVARTMTEMGSSPAVLNQYVKF